MNVIASFSTIGNWVTSLRIEDDAPEALQRAGRGGVGGSLVADRGNS